MEKKTNKNDLENRLNQIKNRNSEKASKEENNSKKAKEKDNISFDFISLKDKVKMDNAPELKEIKDLDKNIQTIKEGFSSASSTNAVITK